MTETAREGRRTYLIGYAWATGLTLLAFAAVFWDLPGGHWTLDIVAAAAVVQIFLHLRYFLHLGLWKSRREDLQLVLFATLLIMLMVGGSLWIMFDLNERMLGLQPDDPAETGANLP